MSTATVLAASLDASVAPADDWTAELLRRHDGVPLRPVPDESSGSDEPRSVLAAFPSATDALAVGIEFRERLDGGARIALATGDVAWSEEPGGGLPAEIAAQLRELVEPGGFLVTAAVAMLAIEPPGVELAPGERVRLADGRLVDTATVTGADRPARDGTLPPGFERARAERPFVGRTDELATLSAAWQESVAGRSRTVLMGGEAGAGKSRLVAEFAASDRLDGAIVVAGRCESNLALPYQPWLAILDQLLQQLPTSVRADRREALDALEILDPRSDRFLHRGGARSADHSTGAVRHGLFHAIRAMLEEACAHAPLLVIIEDLHWAGRQTLDLVSFLTRAEPLPRALLVATFRDTRDELDPMFLSVLAELRRVEAAQGISLGGLDLVDLRQLVAATGIRDRREGERTASRIAERTAGNPFLVWELLAGGDPTGGTVPDSVRDVVAARLAGLSRASRRLAEVIACAERIDVGIACAAIGARPMEAGDALDELFGVGLIEEVPEAGDSVRFTHDLLRLAVIDQMQPFARGATHMAIAEALERDHESDRRPVLTELTHHFAAAGSSAGRQKAAYYGRRSAAHARRSGAYEEAAALLQVVLDVLPDGSAERGRLLVELLDLSLRSGRLADAAVAGVQAFHIASELGDERLRAEAAIGFERAAHLGHDQATRQQAVEMLESVIRTEHADEPPLGLRLQAAVGRARTMVGDPAGMEAIRDAVQAAEQLGDHEALAAALEAATFGYDPAELLDVTEQLERIGEEHGDVWRSILATGGRSLALITLGRVDEAEQALLRHARYCDEFRLEFFRFSGSVIGSMVALAQGRLDLAETQIEQALTVSERGQIPGGRGVHGVQMFLIRREQGRLEEMRPVLRLLVTGGDSHLWGPGLAVALAELGMVAEAERELDRQLADGLAAVPRDSVWPIALSFLADACFLLGRTDVAALFADELAPFAGRTLSGFSAATGPTDRLRGAMACLLGRHDEAELHFSAARALARQHGAVVWEAQVERTWARALERGGDLDSAEVHRRRALALNPLVAMPTSNADAEPVVCCPDEPVSSAHRLSSREREVLALLATGLSNREIADRLFISANTAANHVRSILRKTGTANRTEAAALAFREGLLEESDRATGSSP